MAQTAAPESEGARPRQSVQRALTANRWLICVAIGLLLYLCFPGDWGVAVRSATAWIGATAAFLAWTVLAVGKARPERLRELARRQDFKDYIIFAFAILAATASLIAVSVLLRAPHGQGGGEIAFRIVLVAGVVVTAWLLTHTIFAVHYTHGFYGDGLEPGSDDRGGVQFPGKEQHPDFWDFLYFSLVIGMTCQVSDVQITGAHIRRLATIHGAIAFFFNTIILAITVNVVVNAF
jgi:uncharacterized membrane protein